MQTNLLTKCNVATIGEEITHELGAQMVKDYGKAHPNEFKSCIIGKEILGKILAQPGCAGIQFYYAINELGQKTLVYVGLDQNGKQMVNYSVVTTDAQLQAEKGIVADRAVPSGDDPFFGDDCWFINID